MRYFISAFVLFMSFSCLSAQGKFFTKKGNVTFKSDTPIEVIEGVNKTSTFIVDSESGKLQIAILIKAFQFEKALLQEHFNENYMESSKFPKATFKGQINNIADIDLRKDGIYDAKISGKMTIHGVTNEIDVDGTFTVEDGEITGKSAFVIAVADYGIKIPKLVRENIAKEVSTNVFVQLEELKK